MTWRPQRFRDSNDATTWHFTLFLTSYLKSALSNWYVSQFSCRCNEIWKICPRVLNKKIYPCIFPSCRVVVIPFEITNLFHPQLLHVLVLNKYHSSCMKVYYIFNDSRKNSVACRWLQPKLNYFFSTSIVVESNINNKCTLKVI